MQIKQKHYNYFSSFKNSKFHLNRCQSLTKNVRRSRLGPNLEFFSTHDPKQNFPEFGFLFVDDRVRVVDDLIRILVEKCCQNAGGTTTKNVLCNHSSALEIGLPQTSKKPHPAIVNYYDFCGTLNIYFLLNFLLYNFLTQPDKVQVFTLRSMFPVFLVDEVNKVNHIRNWNQLWNVEFRCFKVEFRC